MQLFSETERLLIRPLQIDDSAFILQLLNTDGWLRFIGDRGVRNSAQASNYIHDILSKKDYSFHVFSLKEKNVPIGLITQLKRPELPDSDLGFAMLPNFASQGFAYEAAREIVSEIKRLGKQEFLYAITLSGNERSINLLQKLGMTYKEQVQENNIQLDVYWMRLTE